MSAPLVVNTEDGTCWTRRDAVRDGQPLYAMADCQRCPELVMATYAELAEHGIVGSADVLPMPSGSAPVDAGPVVRPLALHEAQIDALAAAGNRVVNDQSHEDLCACDGWPERCLSSGGFFQGQWDVGGLETAIPAVLGLWESMRGGELERLRAEVAALRNERHTTNEALSDAAEALRANAARIAELEAQREALAERMRAGQYWKRGRNPELVSENLVSQSELRGIFGIPLAAPWADGITQRIAPAQTLREVVDGEHYAAVHHDYAKGRDDLRDLGGQR